MATISIDYNSENKEVYLCGDIEADIVNIG